MCGKRRSQHHFQFLVAAALKPVSGGACYTNSVQNQTSIQRSKAWWSVVPAVFLSMMCFGGPFLVAQGVASNQASVIPAAELIRASVDNEVASSRDAAVKHMFRSRKQNPRGSQTKLYVETRDAMVGMVIAYNDQPLTQEQRQGEEGRLAWLLNNPEQLNRKRAQEKDDAERTLRLIKALPDALVYQYTGTEATPAGMGKPGDPLLRLTFKPNPRYVPPSRVEQVLAGMQGYILVDAAIRRIVKIDGTLFKDVSFGWGFLGHLDKGGHFLVEQSEVGDGTWEITHMSLNFTGKILLFKGISIATDEVLSDFRRVPADTTFAQGVDLLKMEQAKLAKNGEAAVKKAPR